MQAAAASCSNTGQKCEGVTSLHQPAGSRGQNQALHPGTQEFLDALLLPRIVGYHFRAHFRVSFYGLF